MYALEIYLWPIVRAKSRIDSLKVICMKTVEAVRPPENVDESRAVTLKVDPTVGNVSCPFNFTRDQFPSDAFWVNLVSRNIKWNRLYQTSYLIFCFHVNTIVYLQAIANPVENQNLLWTVWETKPENWRNLFISVFV